MKDDIRMVNYPSFCLVGKLIRGWETNPQFASLQQFTNLLTNQYCSMSILMREIDDKFPGDPEYDDLRRDHRRVRNRILIANQILADEDNRKPDLSKAIRARRIIFTSLLLFVCFPLQASLIDPIAGGYSYETDSGTYEGDLVAGKDLGILQNWEGNVGSTKNRFAVVKSYPISYITANLTTEDPGTYEGWIDFTTTGKFVELISHPVFPTTATYYLDGEVLNRGESKRISHGTHRFGFSGTYVGLSGGNLQVTTIPEPSGILIATGALLLFLFLIRRTK